METVFCASNSVNVYPVIVIIKLEYLSYNLLYSPILGKNAKSPVFKP
nr:MAG TPA: hypothetical protein [Caudoviricetes sp.]